MITSTTIEIEPAKKMSVFSLLLNDPRTLALAKALTPYGDLYLVGGAIRDAVLGKDSKDLDFSYSLSPDQTIEILEKEGIRVIPSGLSHQTVTAKIYFAEGDPNNELPHVEITSFRNSEMNPHGGVFLGQSIEEDLIYRDFTINALALSITLSEDKNSVITETSIIDPTQGTTDINNKIIRTCGEAEKRFLEDPLRILRMIRFATTLDFNIEDSTAKKGRELFSKLQMVSMERVREEFLKILTSNFPRKGLLLLKDFGFYDLFLPEMATCVDFEQNKFHKHDVFIHTIDVVEKSKPTKLSRLAAFFHDIGKPPSLSVDEKGERHFYLHEKIGSEMMDEIGPRLKFSNEETSAIKKLVYTHMRPIDAGSGGLRRILRDTEPYYTAWRELKYADTVAVLGENPEVLSQFADFDTRIKEIQDSEKDSPYKTLAINGNDLIALGFKPGPEFKKILHHLHELVMDEPSKNTKDTLQTVIQETFKK